MKKIRVLLSKLGLDSHDRGIKILAQILRDSGMEIIYPGKFVTPEMVVQIAIQEDVDVIGLSMLSGGHLVLVPKVIDLLETKNVRNDLLILVGGVIPSEDIVRLKKEGVNEVFATSGTLGKDVVAYIRRELGKKNID